MKEREWMLLCKDTQYIKVCDHFVHNDNVFEHVASQNISRVFAPTAGSVVSGFEWHFGQSSLYYDKHDIQHQSASVSLQMNRTPPTWIQVWKHRSGVWTTVRKEVRGTDFKRNHSKKAQFLMLTVSLFNIYCGSLDRERESNAYMQPKVKTASTWWWQKENNLIISGFTQEAYKRVSEELQYLGGCSLLTLTASECNLWRG